MGGGINEFPLTPPRSPSPTALLLHKYDSCWNNNDDGGATSAIT